MKKGGYRNPLEGADMILHLAPDEKFIDMGIASFERVAPGTNHLVLFRDTYETKYVRTAPVEVFSGEWFEPKISSLCLEEYDVVVLHSASRYSGAFFDANRSRIRAPLVWLAWGYDYYPELERRRLIQTSGARTAEWSRPSTVARLKGVVRPLLGKNGRGRTLTRNLRAEAAICAPVLINESEMIRGGIPEFRGEFADWNYGTLEDDLIIDERLCVASEGDVWFGNSATPTNNHLDAFRYLSPVLDTGKRIHAPLSYGDPEYGSHVLALGKQFFGEQFDGLITFVSTERYRSMIASSTYFVMPHIRQQALGNIVMAMYMGGRVFLDRRSPTWQFFKERNAVVFSLEQFADQFGKGRLLDEEVEINREILRECWSRKAIDRKTIVLLERAEQLRSRKASTTAESDLRE